MSFRSEPMALSHKGSRRETLLMELVDLFLAEGFLNFSVEDLAARLRRSKSTLYQIAPTKDQIIVTVVRAFFRRSTERVDAQMAEELDPVTRVGTYLGSIATELSAASPQFYADLAVFAPAGEVYRQNTQIAAERVHELVQDLGHRRNAIDAPFVGEVARLVIEGIHRGEMRRATGLVDAQAFAYLADLIVYGVGGDVIDRS